MLRIGYSLLRKTPEWGTLQYLIQTKCSLARFGDGELLFFKHNRGVPTMQEFDQRLKRKMQKIFVDYPIPNLLIAVHDGERWKRYFKQDASYGSASLFRPSYLSLDCKMYFDKVKSLWEGKEIVIVNFNHKVKDLELFDNVSNIVCIDIPMRHCFRNYNDIQHKCSFFYGQNKIFLVTAGPTASVLAYDLTKAGERCIDIGKIGFEFAKWKGYDTKTLVSLISQDTWKEKRRVWKYDEDLKKIEVLL